VLTALWGIQKRKADVVLNLRPTSPYPDEDEGTADNIPLDEV